MNLPRRVLPIAIILCLLLGIAIGGVYFVARSTLQNRDEMQSALKAQMQELRSRQPSKLDDLMRGPLPTAVDVETASAEEQVSGPEVFPLPQSLSDSLSDDDLEEFKLKLERATKSGGNKVPAMDLFDASALMAIALSTNQPAPPQLRSYQREFGDSRLSAAWSLLPPLFPYMRFEYGSQSEPRFIKKILIGKSEWALFRRVAYGEPVPSGSWNGFPDGIDAPNKQLPLPAEYPWISTANQVISLGTSAHYYAVRLHRYVDGNVKIVDWFDLQRGWPRSQLLRDEFAREFFGKLPVNEFRVDSAMETERVLTIAHDAETRNEIAYAFELLESLKSVRRVDVQQIRLGFLAKHNRGELPAAVRELRSHLPYPLVADVLLRTLGKANRLMVTELSAVQQLRQHFSPDPYWSVYDAERALFEGNLDAAAAAVPQILNDDPTLWFAEVLKLPAALRNQDHATATEIINRISKNYSVRPDSFVSTTGAEHLTKSNEFIAVKPLLQERFDRRNENWLKMQQQRANAFPSAIGFRSQ